MTDAVGARWKRPHDRWISYRSLAENLRSAPFLAMLGTESGRDLGSDPLRTCVSNACRSTTNIPARVGTCDDDPGVSGLLVWDEPGRLTLKVHSIFERACVQS
jgi:hypothetical protein